MDFLKELETTTSISSQDILDLIAKKIDDEPELLWHYSRIVRLVMRHGVITQSLPNSLVRLLVINHHEGILSMIRREDRTRMFLLQEGEEEVSFLSMAIMYNFLALMEFLAEPTQACMTELLDHPFDKTWVPLFQNLIHQNCALLETIKQFLTNGPSELTERIKPYMDDFMIAASKDYEPRETTRITFRIPTMYQSRLV